MIKIVYVCDNMSMENETSTQAKPKKKTWLKVLIISLSSVLVLSSAALLTAFILVYDKNRCEGTPSETATSEIIRKNYVNGFDNIKDTGKFTFGLSEDDVNSLLAIGKKSINNDHISAIYYSRSDENHHTFYVDLEKTFIKTRVVIDTTASLQSDLTYVLKVERISIGKINFNRILDAIGNAGDNLLNDYFKASKLPITYSGELNQFLIKPKEFISLFPKNNICSTFFDLVIERPNTVEINPNSMGFSVDFSSLRKSDHVNFVPSAITYGDFYNDLKDECESQFPGLTSGTTTVYKITKAEFNQLVCDSLPSTRQTVISDLTGDKEVVFEALGSQTSFLNDYVYINLVYSLNGYEVDVTTKYEFILTAYLLYNGSAT